MDSERVEIEYNKIKNLRQYKNFSEEKLRRVAFNRAVEHNANISDLFNDEVEKKLAKTLIKKYLESYTPETVSDVNTLRSVIFLEILNLRLQDKMNTTKELSSRDSLNTVNTIHNNLKEILSLKNSLGMVKDKKKAGAKSVDVLIGQWKKQFKVWCSNNQATRQRVCPYCYQMFLLKIRPEYWEVGKHPFFKDRILYNKPLVDLYLEKVITKEKLAKILECSEDYIDWLLKKIHITKEKEKLLNDTTDK